MTGSNSDGPCIACTMHRMVIPPRPACSMQARVWASQLPVQYRSAYSMEYALAVQKCILHGVCTLYHAQCPSRTPASKWPMVVCCLTQHQHGIRECTTFGAAELKLTPRGDRHIEGLDGGGHDPFSIGYKFGVCCLSDCGFWYGWFSALPSIWALSHIVHNYACCLSGFTCQASLEYMSDVLILMGIMNSFEAPHGACMQSYKPACIFGPG